MTQNKRTTYFQGYCPGCNRLGDTDLGFCQECREHLCEREIPVDPREMDFEGICPCCEQNYESVTYDDSKDKFYFLHDIVQTEAGLFEAQGVCEVHRDEAVLVFVITLDDKEEEKRREIRQMINLGDCGKEV